MQVKSVREAEVSGKRVLLRVDFNVPIKDGMIVDDMRIRAALPTINLLLERGAQLHILMHLGRPEGKVVESLRTAPIQKRLGKLVDMTHIEVGENLRFDPREESNDESFAKELSSLGDIFVNEAFADSHRAHASIVGIPKFLPSFAGLHMEEEITKLTAGLTPPAGAIAIVGGVKFETKAPLIEKLAGVYSKVFVGGAIANEYTNPLPNIVLPIDGVRDATHVADIGPETTSMLVRAVSEAPFVLWNGPLGLYEGGYTAGTDVVAHALAVSGTAAVIGGGDTVAAIEKFSFNPNKVFVSTGGGAMLEFLTSGTLPGIEPLKK